MRTRHVPIAATLIAAIAPVSVAETVHFSNFGEFIAGANGAAQASAVTAANNAVIIPFISNTASMQVVLSEAASVRTIRVLAPTLYVQDHNSMMPRVGFGADPSGDLDPRDIPTPASDAGSLAPLRVSIYASASDVESRNALASVDFGAGEYSHSVWGQNNSFYEIGFDLGQTFDLGAGDWFIEVAQIDPASAQFFLALDEGLGMHRFDVNSFGLVNSNFEFALQIGNGVLIPLPTGGALALMGVSAVIARRRRA